MQPPSIEPLCVCVTISLQTRMCGCDILHLAVVVRVFWSPPQEIYPDKLLFWHSFTTFPSCVL